jgi:DNA-binding PadR family transcriptional regulator
MARQGRVYASSADSQYYAEPKRLQRLGYLSAEQQPGRTHPRTHYRLTERAYEALREWARQPVLFPGISSRPIVRLMAADLVGEEAVVEGLRALRADVIDLMARLDVAEAVAETLPHRRRYLLLNHALARKILQAHLEWLDEIERPTRAPARSGASRPRRARRSGNRP